MLKYNVLCKKVIKEVSRCNQISHSHRLTRRVWKPNLQVTTLNVNGSPIKVKVCARTLKTLKGASEVEVMRILKANIATLSERLLKHLNK